MEYEAKNINWNCLAGQQLDRLATLLPLEPRLDITVSDSAPLQMLLNAEVLSDDISLFASGNNRDYLVNFICEKTLGLSSKHYIQVYDFIAFRSTVDWMTRAVEVQRHGHTFRFVHPWDVLVSKLQRLEEKDIEAFKVVIGPGGSRS